jgi:hypothetical protein
VRRDGVLLTQRPYSHMVLQARSRLQSLLN